MGVAELRQAVTDNDELRQAATDKDELRQAVSDNDGRRSQVSREGVKVCSYCEEGTDCEEIEAPIARISRHLSRGCQGMFCVEITASIAERRAGYRW